MGDRKGLAWLNEALGVDVAFIASKMDAENFLVFFQAFRHYLYVLLL